MADSVLIVDDHREFVLGLRLFLEGQGYRVLEAHDGAEGLEVIRRERPDLVILDVLMPRVDGWTALRLLQSQEETATIPVLILTALSEPISVVHGYKLGCTWFCSKPVATCTDLALVVRRLLDVARDEAQLLAA